MKIRLHIPLAKMLSAHYELFYPVIVDEERLCNYTFISVYAQIMTHRGPMGDNEKISHNTQICLFQRGKKRILHEAQSTNKSHNYQVIFIRHPCGFDSQIQMLSYKCEIQLLYFYNAMLVNEKVLSTKQNILSRENFYGGLEPMNF